MAGKAVWDYLFDDEAPAAPVVDAGPAARRAAAGMPPEAGTVDPDPNGPTTAEGRAGGPLYGNAFNPKAPAKGGTPPGPTEIEADPAGTVAPFAGMYGKVVTPLLARATGPVVAPVATGAYAGAVTGASTGDPSEVGPGAFMGALAPGLRGVLGGVGEAEAKAMHARGDSRVYREIGRNGTMPQRAVIEKLGRDKVGKVANELGLTHAPDKRVPVMNALRGTGQEIGDVFTATDAAGHARDLSGIMKAIDDAHADVTAKRGALAGKALAPVFEEEKQRVFDTFRNTTGAGARVPLGELNKAIGTFESTGFSGNAGMKLSPAAKAVASRAIADRLNGELEAGLSVAAQDPMLRDAVGRLPELNSRYQALKALEPVVKRMHLKQEFPATVPLKDRAGNALRSAATAPFRAGDAMGRAVGSRAAGEVSDAVVGGASAAGQMAKPPVRVPPTITPLSPITYGALKDNNRDRLQAQLAAELFPK